MASIQEITRKTGRRWRVQTYVDGRRRSRMFRTQPLAEAWASQIEGRDCDMAELRRLLQDQRIMPLLPLKFREAVERAKYSEREIIASRFWMDYDSGIYFLIRDDRIYYVGQTTCVLARILKHRRNGRKFDSFAFIPCLPEHLDELERVYITLLLPAENAKGI
jgi:hypothetical protein